MQAMLEPRVDSKDVKNTMIYIHVLNRVGKGVKSRLCPLLLKYKG